jgi:hypothetical protein
VIYLSGHIRQSLRHPMLGYMNTPQMANILPPGVTWAADNGRFSAPAQYTDAGYLGWLARQPMERCLFAVAPDVLADHTATIHLSRPLFPRLRALGYRAGFVAQDGWREYDTPWDEFDCLFLGGSTTFKLGRGAAAVAAARARGKWAHMGRVNSYRRLRLAAAIGCHSADGTFLKFGPDVNEPRMLAWLEALAAAPLLKFWDGWQSWRCNRP